MDFFFNPLLHSLFFFFLLLKDYDFFSIIFLRYDPPNNSYHPELEGSGLICSAVDILPTEFAKEVQ